jgi:pimeloyl-ACP methyl ester carboxylesterase
MYGNRKQLVLLLLPAREADAQKRDKLMKQRTRTPGVVLLALATLFSVLSVVGPADASEVTSEDLAKPLRWQVCFEDEAAFAGVVFECADIRVPLDYDRPFGSTVEVQMVRIPASDQENRKGAILLNPGGPGGSGIDFALGFGPSAGFVFGPDVAAQFDIIGFDPRGIERSQPVRCFSNANRAFQFDPMLAFPLNPAEEALFEKRDRELAKACRRWTQARRHGQHSSTANVARDMDVIRASLGDEQSNFLGLSYGTYLGAVYANLFPDRVRSVVVDGVLDPIAWVNAEAEIPFSTRLKSDVGAADTLDEFFRQCDAAQPGNCALAPNSEDRYRAVLDALRAEPVEITDPETGEQFIVRYQDVVGLSLGVLYNPFDYSFLAFLIADLESQLAGAGDASFGKADVAFARERYSNGAEGFPAVACADSNNPTSYDAWSQAAADAEAENGYFGPLWTWISSPCAQWPFTDRDAYQGPFTAETANPVLIVGPLYDPATRYEGAEALRSLLPNSGLLAVDVPSHTSLGASFCAGAVVGQYFLDPATAVAVDGETCPAEFNAFDVVAPPPEGEDGASGNVSSEAAADMSQLMSLRETVVNSMVGGFGSK